jgi:hypothetical protein
VLCSDRRQDAIDGWRLATGSGEANSTRSADGTSAEHWHLTRHEEDTTTVDPDVVDYLVATPVSVVQHGRPELSEGLECVPDGSPAGYDLRSGEKVLRPRPLNLDVR